MLIKRGTILTLESGEYSDSAWHGPFNVLREFDQENVRDLFLGQWANQHPELAWNRAEILEFIAWLHRNGYIEDVPQAQSWHLGGYEFDPEISWEPMT